MARRSVSDAGEEILSPAEREVLRRAALAPAKTLLDLLPAPASVRRPAPPVVAPRASLPGGGRLRAADLGGVADGGRLPAPVIPQPSRRIVQGSARPTLTGAADEGFRAGVADTLTTGLLGDIERRTVGAFAPAPTAGVRQAPADLRRGAEGAGRLVDYDALEAQLKAEEDARPPGIDEAAQSIGRDLAAGNFDGVAEGAAGAAGYAASQVLADPVGDVVGGPLLRLAGAGARFAGARGAAPEPLPMPRVPGAPQMAEAARGFVAAGREAAQGLADQAVQVGGRTARPGVIGPVRRGGELPDEPPRLPPAPEGTQAPGPLVDYDALDAQVRAEEAAAIDAGPLRGADEPPSLPPGDAPPPGGAGGGATPPPGGPPPSGGGGGVVPPSGSAYPAFTPAPGPRSGDTTFTTIADADKVAARMRQLTDAQVEAQKAGDLTEMQRLGRAIRDLDDLQTAMRPRLAENTGRVGRGDRLTNPAKWANLSQQGRALFGNVMEKVEQDLVRNGQDPQARVSWDSVVAEARALDPSQVDRLKARTNPKEALNRVEYEAVRGTINDLTNEAVRLDEAYRQALAAAEAPGAGAAQREAAQVAERALSVVERDVEQFAKALSVSRSEKGRELAYLRQVAATGFNQDYWLSRAARLSGGPLGGPRLQGLVRTLTAGEDAVRQVEAARASGNAGALAVAEGRVRQQRIHLALQMARIEETPMLELALGLRKAGLLSGVKTTARNLTGNVISVAAEELSMLPAAVHDMLASLVTGRERTIYPEATAAAWATAMREMPRALREAVEVMRYGATEDDLVRLEIPRELVPPTLANPALRATLGEVLEGATFLANNVMRFQGAQDRLFRVPLIARHLYELHYAQVRTEVRRGTLMGPTGRTYTRRDIPAEVARRVQQSIDTGIEDAATREAVAMAEFTIFQNDTAVSKGLSALSRTLRTAGDVDEMGTPAGQALRLSGKTAYALMNFIVSFVKTPAAVADRVLEYAGPGQLIKRPAVMLSRRARQQQAQLAGELAERVSPQEARAASMMFGRGAVGSAFMYLGYLMYREGLLTPPGQSNNPEADKAAGWTPGSIRAGGTSTSISPFSPIGNLLLTGAALGKANSDPINVPARVTGAVLRTVLDQPFLQGVKQATDAMSERGDDSVREAQGFASGVVGSFVPGIVNEAAQAFGGGVKRDPRAEGPLMDAWNRIRSRVPGLRNTLPQAQDSLGRGRDEPSGLQAFNPFAGPTDRSGDPIVNAALSLGLRLPGETKEVQVGRGAARRPVPLTIDQRRDLLEAEGVAVAEAMAGRLQQDLPDDENEQAEILQVVITRAASRARRDWMEANEAELERQARAQSSGATARARRSAPVRVRVMTPPALPAPSPSPQGGTP